MPKVKTNRGAAKRFKLTAKGKIKRNKAFRRHILSKKSTARKRDLRMGGYVHQSDRKEVLRLLIGC